MCTSTISKETFAAVCFAVLMQNGEGILSKAPSYIEEKQRMLTMGFYAFGELDSRNQDIVRRWCNRWRITPFQYHDEVDFEQWVKEQYEASR